MSEKITRTDLKRSERFTEWFGTMGACLLYLIAVIPILNPMFFFPMSWDQVDSSPFFSKYELKPFELAGWVIIMLVGFFSYRTDFFSRRSIIVPVPLTFICAMFYFIGQNGFQALTFQGALFMMAYLGVPWFGGVGIAALMFNRPHRIVS